MSALGDTVRKAIDDALCDAIKERFARIASNEITIGADEGGKQLHGAFLNLKLAHEQAVKIASEIFD